MNYTASPRGILNVALYEATGFSVPEQYQDLFEARQASNATHYRCTSTQHHLDTSDGAVQRNENWKLVWMEMARAFHLLNRRTKEQNMVPVRKPRRAAGEDDGSKPIRQLCHL
jgi:hypothetical protein